MSRLCRLFPPLVSGKLVSQLRKFADVFSEKADFVTSSSLAPLTFAYEGHDAIAIHFALRGFNEWRNIVIANVLCKPGDTIVEVGAHLGTETLHYAAVVGPTGHVIAFEPVQANAAQLRRTLERNGIQHVQVEEAAVTSASGSLTFQVSSDPTNQAIGSIWTRSDAQSQSIEVKAVALDDVVRNRALTQVRLIVSDAEGAEPDVLAGAEEVIRTQRPYLLLENNAYHLLRRGSSSEALEAYLNQLGYRCFEVARFGLQAPREREWYSNWICLPNDNAADAERLARQLHRALRRAAFLPLWRGLNPAVIGRRI